MFTENEIEEIYTSGGHPKAWKIWKRLWFVIFGLFPIAILTILLTEEKNEAIRMIIFLGIFLACSMPPWLWMNYMMSPNTEKNRIKKLDAAGEGIVTKHFRQYGLNSFYFTYSVNGEKMKGFESCQELPKVGAAVTIAYLSKKPKCYRYIPIGKKNSQDDLSVSKKKENETAKNDHRRFAPPGYLKEQDSNQTS
jgi:hypothetical protein